MKKSTFRKWQDYLGYAETKTTFRKLVARGRGLAGDISPPLSQLEAIRMASGYYK